MGSGSPPQAPASCASTGPGGESLLLRSAAPCRVSDSAPGPERQETESHRSLHLPFSPGLPGFRRSGWAPRAGISPRLPADTNTSVHGPHRDGQDPEAWSHAAISVVLGGLREFSSAPGPASDVEDGLVQLRTSGLLHRLLTDLIPGLGGVPMVAERPAQASLGQATQPRGAGQRGPQASGGFWTSREDSGF